jgi:hypothetical protein
MRKKNSFGLPVELFFPPHLALSQVLQTLFKSLVSLGWYSKGNVISLQIDIFNIDKCWITIMQRS